MLLLTITDSVLLTLWGWPGLLAVLLVSWHFADRHFRWRRRLSGRAKLAVAAAGLAVGLAFGGREWSLPADDRTLGEEIERRHGDSAASRVSPRERLDAAQIAGRLRRDLQPAGRSLRAPGLGRSATPASPPVAGTAPCC